MKVDNLAIVIPAYKIDFLHLALQSIADQGCKRFRLYIGDDASPSALQQVVEKFSDKINLVYHRFEQNKGGTDLVAHWERCIDLVEEEEFIWLFSDDDVMGEDCVAKFYEALADNPAQTLFHFNIKVIDAAGAIINTPPKFPQHLQVTDFHIKRWQSKLSSYVVEYIFQKKAFLKAGRFQKFDFAWHSDEATWTKLGVQNGIYTIEGADIYWRRSEVNITQNTRDEHVIRGKLSADLAFTLWVTDFYKENKLSFTLKRKFFISKRFTHHLFKNKSVLQQEEWREYLLKGLNMLHFRWMYPVFSLYYKFLQTR